MLDEHTTTRPRVADIQDGQHVRIVAPLWRSQALVGVVVYVGQLIEVELDDGAVVSFLPSEVEPMQ